MQQKHHAEALPSFQRIDNLIARIGVITRQLKPYTRKGPDDIVQPDTCDCVLGPLSMMSPQIPRMQVQIPQTLPPNLMQVMGDMVHIEQVSVNPLRHAHLIP